MGVAYYIVLERDIEGLDTMMDGKSLAKAWDELDTVAGSLGITTLSEFISIDPEMAAEFLDEVDAESVKLPPLKQFSSDGGLKTVQALLAHLTANPESAPRAEGVLMDLRECERILSEASREGVKWHFAIDI